MEANAEIFFEHGKLGRPLALSVGLHVAFTGVIVLFSMLPGRRGDIWGAGGGGEAMGVSLVSSVRLPASPIQTQNVVANESKGLTKSQPQEKQNERDAITIRDMPATYIPKRVLSASY